MARRRIGTAAAPSTMRRCAAAPAPTPSVQPTCRLGLARAASAAGRHSPRTSLTSRHSERKLRRSASTATSTCPGAASRVRRSSRAASPARPTSVDGAGRVGAVLDQSDRLPHVRVLAGHHAEQGDRLELEHQLDRTSHERLSRVHSGAARRSFDDLMLLFAAAYCTEYTDYAYSRDQRCGRRIPVPERDRL